MRLRSTPAVQSCTPYIAVSYTRAQDPTFVPGPGRCVTTQALDIAAQLANYASLALWIDATCIDKKTTP